MFTAGLGLVIVAMFGCSNGTGSNTQQVDPGVADNNKTASNPTAENPEPKFEFKHTDWDFGKINEGEEVKHTFRFTNVGDEDLVIRKCQVSCGCTVAKCDRKPIAPGESSEIQISFDSNRKPGIQVKNVTIMANTNPPETVLTFRAVVLPNE